MSTETTSIVPTTTIDQGIVSTVDDRGSVHEKAVAEIVGMIRAKYEDESTRNFAIGKRAFEHAVWQRGNFPGYTGSDFDTLMRRVRDDVRLYVPIKADSIRVDDWVRCHVMRELVRTSDGDSIADCLSMHEYNRLIGKALTFDKKNVEGSLVLGWIDLVRDVAADRAMENGRVTSEDFIGRIAAKDKAIEASKVTADPVQAAAVKAATEITKKADDSRKANKQVTTAVADALAKGNLDLEGILGIVEHVGKEMKRPLPASFGFDPTKCTVEDCKILAGAMFAAGKFTEMKFLADRLSKMVSAVDKARDAAQHTTSIEPTAAKVAREQVKAESRDGSASKVGAALGRKLGNSAHKRAAQRNDGLSMETTEERAASIAATMADLAVAV